MSDPRWYEPTVCPRCGRLKPPQFPSLSRVDNHTYVCNDCGTDEAIGAGLIPIEEWPIDGDEA